MPKKEEIKFLYHDTETTGTSTEDRIIETAHALVSNGELLDYKEELCNPLTVSIKPAAAMTHGYRNSDITDKPEFKNIKSANILINLSEDKSCYYVAHNAPFDIGMLEKEGISWPKNKIIDTLRVSRHFYLDVDEVEMYKLQYFRYLFNEFEEIEPEYMKKFGITHIQPHTALSDILVLWIFTEKLMRDFKVSAKDMVRLSQQPVLETKISFGKVFPKGKLYSEIVSESYEQYGKKKRGYEYLLWAVENMEDLTIDLEYSLKAHLATGIIEGKINTLTSMEKYLNWAILFFFNEKQKEIALSLLKKDDKYLDKLKSSYISQKETVINSLKNKDDLTESDEKTLNKEKFLLNYLKNYR